MCGSGMLWHFVSPGLLDILPFGPIMVALLMTGYYHFGLGHPFCRPDNRQNSTQLSRGRLWEIVDFSLKEILKFKRSTPID